MKLFSKNIIKKILPLFVAILFTGIVFFDNFQNKTYNIARAATYSLLSGYAWSDNIGWISFDCKTGGPTGNNICSTSNYQVGTDGNGILRGYAWSDEAGWISFNENTGCPSAPCRPTLTPSGLTGWARIISVSYPTNPHPQAGGYDGWIDLSTVGRSADGTRLSSYAWASGHVGWISFDCKTGGELANDICSTYPYYVQVTTIVIPDPSVILNLTPSNSASLLYMNPSGNVTLNWTSQNVDTCLATGDWTGNKTLNNTEIIGPLNTLKLHTFNLACTNSDYNLTATSTRTITVTNDPFCGDYRCDTGETTLTCTTDCTTRAPATERQTIFRASPITVKPNNPTTLKWDIIAGQSCKIYNDNTSTLLKSIPDGNQIGEYLTANISERTQYSLRCLGEVDVKVVVNVFSLFEF